MQSWIVPPSVFDSLYRFYKHKIPTGDFLKAVIEDKGWEAASRADITNRTHLADILLFNGQARRFYMDCKNAGDWSGFDLRWEAWRMRYSPEATEIAANLGDDDE